MLGSRRASSVSACGSYPLSISWREMVELYRIYEDQPALNLRPRYNVAPTQDVPIVRLSPNLRKSGREVVRARWGLVPSWARDLSFSYKLTNARDDTVDEKRAL